LGLNYGCLDKCFYDNIIMMLKEKNPFEEWYGDLSVLKDYLDLKR